MTAAAEMPRGIWQPHRILVGDVRERLAEMESDSVHCVVTSPPYWGLRDYGVPRQMGLEPTLAEHIAALVGVFDEVRRVLRPDGTLWLNYGDCYAGSWSGSSMRPEGGSQRPGSPGFQPLDQRYAARAGAVPEGLKPKDLCMVGNRLAIALQDAGWWVRSEIIWAKPNPMPESVTDRPTVAHDKIWLLTKSARYFYDAEAVREGVTGNAHPRRKDGQTLPAEGETGTFNPRIGTFDRQEDLARDSRNLRTVWTISTTPYPGAHFATFPPALAETCIKAGCPEGGIVLDTFAGSGTTGMVADRLGRRSILIELNPTYAEMAAKRIRDDAPMLTSVEIDGHIVAEV